MMSRDFGMSHPDGLKLKAMLADSNNFGMSNLEGLGEATAAYNAGPMMRGGTECCNIQRPRSDHSRRNCCDWRQLLRDRHDEHQLRNHLALN